MKFLGMILAILTIALPASAVTLADGGKSPYVIVIAQPPMPANQRAAEEFQSHFKLICGVELPIQYDDQLLPERAILIGASQHLEALGVTLDKEKLGNDGFVLKTVCERIV